jgi:hypothetical protein
MSKKHQTLIAMTLISVAVVAGWRVRRKTARTEALLNSTAIDRWEDEGGSSLIPGRANDQAR